MCTEMSVVYYTALITFHMKWISNLAIKQILLITWSDGLSVGSCINRKGSSLTATSDRANFFHFHPDDDWSIQLKHRQKVFFQRLVGIREHTFLFIAHYSIGYQDLLLLEEYYIPRVIPTSYCFYRWMGLRMGSGSSVTALVSKLC